MWWGLLVIGGMLALVLAGIGRGERRARRSARRAAARFGLSVDERALHLDGTVDGCTVVAQVTADATGGVLEVVVRPSVGLPVSLGFGPEGWVRAALRVVGEGDVVTGDAAFDAAVFARGEPAMVLAALGPADRRMIARFVAEGGVVDGGELRLRRRGLLVEEPVGEMLRVARRLVAAVADVPGGLAERVRRDPNPGVRLRALALLVAQFSGHAATAGALRAAAGDRDAMVRLAGARMLADGGALRALAGDPGAPVGVRREALAVLGERLPVEQWAVVLVEALDGPCAADAARWLADRGWRAAAPALRGRVMAAGDEAAAAFAGALGRLWDSAAEGVLLACLDRPGVRLAAVEALGAVGSVGALPGLLALTEGALLPGEVKRAASAAVAAIRGRRVVGPVGGLMVVEVTAVGGLAVSEGAGEVALVGEGVMGGVAAVDGSGVMGGVAAVDGSGAMGGVASENGSGAMGGVAAVDGSRAMGGVASENQSGVMGGVASEKGSMARGGAEWADGTGAMGGKRSETDPMAMGGVVSADVPDAIGGVSADGMRAMGGEASSGAGSARDGIERARDESGRRSAARVRREEER